jgi:hypothetical protein
MNASLHPAPAPQTGLLRVSRRSLVFRLALLATLATIPGIRAAETAQPPAAAATPSAEAEPAWKSLFDGKTLAGWKITPFGGHGEVEVKDGQLLLSMGAMLTGVTCTSDIPKLRYEISLEAMKLSGSDFFCGLTFPVSNAFCTLILGGWGGGVVGLSSIDGYDASENETTKYRSFEANRWYAVRVRVTPERIEAWLDNEQIINQSIVGRRISLRPGEIESSVPMGVATFQTTAALRNLKLRSLAAEAPKTAPSKAP